MKKRLFKSNKDFHVIGTFLSENIEKEDILMVIPEDDIAVRLGIVLNIINNTIQTDIGTYTVHEPVNSQNISVRNLYMTGLGITMIMESLSDSNYLAVVKGKDVIVNSNDLFEL